jgi:uncharacterized repeat protein (TIGR02543 family)
MTTKKNSGYGARSAIRAVAVVSALALVALSMAGCPNEADTPTVTNFTVRFDADGGTPAPEEQSIAHGAKATAPPAMTKANHTFGGWFTDNTAFASQWDFAVHTVTADITLYAKWELNRYTVTFNADGGTPTSEQTVAHGAQATKPATDPAKANDVAGLYVGTPPTHYTFVEWQKDGAAYDFDTPVTADITLTAAWTAPSPLTLPTNAPNIIGQSVSYINADSTGITAFTLMLGDNVPDVAGIIHNKNGVTLTITSIGETPVVISKGGAGALFAVNGGATLVIDGYVTLQGISNNTYSLVTVGANGNLELKGNAKITGNTSSNSGSGVAATGTNGNLATVTMSGNAEISGNTSTQTSDGGGGVYLVNYASLTMDGNAAIKNNTVSTTGDARGGGVTIGTNSTFTMNGGEISGNNATGTGTVRGGGVFLFNDTTIRFIVASEAVKLNIKNNTVTAASGTAAGAQVYKGANGVFTVNGVAQGTAGTAQGWDSWD